jgi:hypothetical protein
MATQKKKLLGKQYASKAEAMEMARRLLANADKLMTPTPPIESDQYVDMKPVRGAAGYGYLAAQEAILAHLIGQGSTNSQFPKNFPEYVKAAATIGSQKKKAVGLLNLIYSSLHLGVHYYALPVTSLYKEGIKAVRDLLELVESQPEKKTVRAVNTPTRKPASISKRVNASATNPEG